MSRGRHRSDGPYVVPGERAVIELVRAAPGRVRSILIEHGRSAEALEHLAATAGLKVERCDRGRLAQLAPDGLTRGLAAVAEPPPIHAAEDLARAVADRQEGGVVLALDGVQDPRNLGAMLRTAEFFGVSGVLWARDRAARLTPAAVRASAGASERVPVAIVTNLVRGLDACKDHGLWVVGTLAEGGEPLGSLVAEDRLPERLVVVMGGEHAGLRRLVRDRCDFLATVAGRGRVASLNVSAAAAVVLATLTQRG